MQVSVMGNLILKGEWDEVRGRIKRIYGNLTDHDLLYVEGKDDELLGKLQMRLGKSKEQLRHFIENL
jgi:uncharacterized protein YjbJ (UPF0337 family)